MSDSGWTPPVLTTDRLILRALKESDAEAIFRYSSNPNVARYTLWEPHRSVEDGKQFVHEYAFKKYADNNPEPFGITLKSNPDEVIGTMGCWWNPKNHLCMEMGYALSENFWNQGIATEAAKVVRDYCFENYDVNRIQAHHQSENTASGRIMQKIGMKLEGTHRQRIFAKGRFWDMVVYAILRDDWEKHRA
jgi:ribosomal-protein-alanine N-acetyltransferase